MSDLFDTYKKLDKSIFSVPTADKLSLSFKTDGVECSVKQSLTNDDEQISYSFSCVNDNLTFEGSSSEGKETYKITDVKIGSIKKEGDAVSYVLPIVLSINKFIPSKISLNNEIGIKNNNIFAKGELNHAFDLDKDVSFFYNLKVDKKNLISKIIANYKNLKIGLEKDYEGKISTHIVNYTKGNKYFGLKSIREDERMQNFQLTCLYDSGSNKYGLYGDFIQKELGAKGLVSFERLFGKLSASANYSHNFDDNSNKYAAGLLLEKQKHQYRLIFNDKKILSQSISVQVNSNFKLGFGLNLGNNTKSYSFQMEFE